MHVHVHVHTVYMYSVYTPFILYVQTQTHTRTFIFQNSNAVSLLGHCLYLSGKFSSACDYYERVIEYVNPPAHIGTVLLRLADIYMKANEVSIVFDSNSFSF